MKATIKEVAKEAGVSVATVSRVLNKTAVVSESITSDVMNAVKKLNYCPNLLGRNLRKCETNVILAIIPTTELSYYGEVIRGLQETANQLGYTVMLTISYTNEETKSKLFQMLSNRTVDAAVLLSARIDAETINNLANEYPIALCCESVEGTDVLTVTVDDENGAYSAVNELIKKGHKKIGMVSATTLNTTSALYRENGYKKALKENNIDFNSEYVFNYDYGHSTGEEAFDYFIGLKEPPTAIFVYSDLIAISMIKEGITKGYKIGKDIDIIGFDNILISQLYSPSLSTVAQPSYDIGKIAIEKLIENINSEERNNEKIFLPYQVILRQSTGND